MKNHSKLTILFSKIEKENVNMKDETRQEFITIIDAIKLLEERIESLAQLIANNPNDQTLGSEVRNKLN